MSFMPRAASSSVSNRPYFLAQYCKNLAKSLSASRLRDACRFRAPEICVTKVNRTGVRHIQRIEPNVLSEILQFAFWMRKTGYRNSAVQTCVRALKGLARRTNLLNAESVKSYLANAQLSENRKTELLEDVSRFYANLKVPFSRARYKRVEASIMAAWES
jgi:hypothetical protein